MYVCMYVYVYMYVYMSYIYIYAHVHSCQCAHRKDRPALLFGKVALVDAPKMTWSSQAAVVPSSSSKTEVDEFDLKSYGSQGWLVEVTTSDLALVQSRSLGSRAVVC